MSRVYAICVESEPAMLDSWVNDYFELAHFCDLVKRVAKRSESVRNSFWMVRELTRWIVWRDFPLREH